MGRKNILNEKKSKMIFDLLEVKQERKKVVRMILGYLVVFSKSLFVGYEQNE